jgi:hypothetical protein
MENSVLLGQLITNESVTRFPHGEETIERRDGRSARCLGLVIKCRQ